MNLQVATRSRNSVPSHEQYLRVTHKETLQPIKQNGRRNFLTVLRRDHNSVPSIRQYLCVTKKKRRQKKNQVKIYTLWKEVVIRCHPMDKMCAWRKKKEAHNKTPSHGQYLHGNQKKKMECRKKLHVVTRGRNSVPSHGQYLCCKRTPNRAFEGVLTFTCTLCVSNAIFHRKSPAFCQKSPISHGQYLQEDPKSRFRGCTHVHLYIVCVKRYIS